LLTVAEVVLQMKAAGKEIESKKTSLRILARACKVNPEDGEPLFFNLAAAQEEEEEEENE
jgi:hypothetical protein